MQIQYIPPISPKSHQFQRKFSAEGSASFNIVESAIVSSSACSGHCSKTKDNMNLTLQSFRTINLTDPFFDSLKGDYAEFADWFERKAVANDTAYVFQDDASAIDGIGAQGMFLMPLAFLSNTRTVDGLGITQEERHLMSFLSDQKKAPGVSNDRAFDVALTIEVSMKRSKTSEGAKFSMSADPDAVAMRVEERDIRDTHPWSYDNLSKRLSLRFVDFKANVKYHQLRKTLELNPKLCRERLLDPGNPTGLKKKFYSANIIKEFDPYYDRTKASSSEDL
jgi:hypothetical protein